MQGGQDETSPAKTENKAWLDEIAVADICNRLIMPPMYLEHYGLLESPFSIAPDPRYLYMSEQHREALAHLLYGMASDGAFILLTGDVGTGKTTVSRCLLEQVPEDTNLALVLNPKVSAIELLQVICDELRIDYNDSDISVKTLVDYINRYLLGAHAQGKKTVVLIEEAQNLDLDVLEQLRLLTNLETNERKLLQVILLGQPEFLDVLDLPELSQLAQRITARFHLIPLKLNEVEEYISHRLAIAGCRRPLFVHGVIKQLYHYSGGVPRLINVICDRALLGCYVQNRHQVDKPTLVTAAREVLGENKAALIRAKTSPAIFRWFAMVVLILLLVGVVVYVSDFKLQSPSTIAKHMDETTEYSDSVELIDKSLTAEAEQQTKKIALAQTEHTFIQWPDSNQRMRSNLQAYQALFERWQLSYRIAADGTPCFYALTQGLSCMHEQSNFDGLRKLNRPAILKLYDDFNQPHYTALLEMGQTTAKVFMADRAQTIPLEQLRLYWKGEFSLLWRKPADYQDIIRPGFSGKIVVWLSQVMSQINKLPHNIGHSYYDGELVEQVKAFQLRQGLIDDGVVGVKTLIHINQLTGQKAPLLETG